MKSITKYIWPLLAGVFIILWLQQCNKEPKVEEVIIEKVVKIPEIVHVFDTIVPKPIPTTIKKIDSVFYKEYLQLKDSISKDSAFKKAIEIKEYNQEFKDSVQDIQVYTKTRGDILEQSLSYNIKPREVIIKDTIKIPQKSSINFGGGIGLPIGDPLNRNPILKAELLIIGKNKNTTSFSYDTQGTFWVTKTFKIFNSGKNK